MGRTRLKDVLLKIMKFSLFPPRNATLYAARRVVVDTLDWDSLPQEKKCSLHPRSTSSNDPSAPCSYRLLHHSPPPLSLSNNHLLSFHSSFPLTHRNLLFSLVLASAPPPEYLAIAASSDPTAKVTNPSNTVILSEIPPNVHDFGHVLSVAFVTLQIVNPPQRIISFQSLRA